MDGLGGGCLCGAVRFVLHGELRDVLVCHCHECRRWHGGPGPYTSLPAASLELLSADALQFVASPQSVTGAERGFCRACGSSLIWRVPGSGTVSVAAGTLDEPTGLRTSGHIYDAERGDWEHLDDLPRTPGSASA